MAATETGQTDLSTAAVAEPAVAQINLLIVAVAAIDQTGLLLAFEAVTVVVIGQINLSIVAVPDSAAVSGQTDPLIVLAAVSGRTDPLIVLVAVSVIGQRGLLTVADQRDQSIAVVAVLVTGRIGWSTVV